MKRTVCIFAALLLLLSCGNKKEEVVVVNFSREEIPEQQELRDAEPVVLEDTYNNPFYYWVLQDSIVLANNQSGSEYFLEFFSLRTRQRLLGVGTHGNGPGEFLNLIAFVPNCQAETFLAIDLNRNLYFEIDWKKTLEKKELEIVRSFRYSSQIHPQIPPLVWTDSTYVAYRNSQHDRARRIGSKSEYGIFYGRGKWGVPVLSVWKRNLGGRLPSSSPPPL